MKLSEIEKLIGLVCEKKLTEFNYKTGEEHLIIRKEKEMVERVPLGPQPLQKLPNPFEMINVVKEEPKPLPAQPKKKEEEKGFVVTSPLVGTFYRAPSPGTPPFVEVGSRVEKGQVLCIVEAMKLMNEIEAEKTGTIARIFVENETPVEFGEKLFLIE